MRRAARIRGRIGHPSAARDRGVSFVEVLVALVLLGTVVVATLAGLRAAIVAGTLDQNHSKAYAWLQSASDQLAQVDYKSCGSFSNVDIVEAYQDAADTAPRPDDWGATGSITVKSVRYLSRNASTNVETWGSTCAAGSATVPIYPQLVTLEVVSPDLKLTKSIEVMKSA